MAEGEETREYIYGNGYQKQREYFAQNVEGWFRNNDFGAITGLRFEYRVLPKVKIYTALQAALGFVKLGDDSEDETSGPAPSQLKNFKNRTVTASFGLAIPVVQN
jgi:hypothetical protein